jgi:hypothetical protein
MEAVKLGNAPDEKSIVSQREEHPSAAPDGGEIDQ